MTEFTLEEKQQIEISIESNDDLPDELYLKLYEHFVNNGDMPYGTAKARDGDPFEWVGDHMHEVL